MQTADGSSTLFHPQVGEHYHSKHGAVQESQHVFINKGLDHFVSQNPAQNVSILEVGFGTGLNFILSAAYAQDRGIELSYHGIEAHPLPSETISQLGHQNYVPASLWADFIAVYDNALKGNQQIGSTQLAIIHQKLLDFQSQHQYDVLYFDAFAAVHQPDMWTEESIAHACSFLRVGGIFVTYAITGNLKRTMKSLDFDIEKVPGAPGKREMLRAQKF